MADDKFAAWRRWGPYLSEREWGTVREDDTGRGDAWNDFPHDHARSRAYRWGEDGLAGFADDRQRLCLALALWNGHDTILKERLFGLTSDEGNHGEDVKEYYYYLDATPTHSYLKWLYKYPQRAYPYRDLLDANRARTLSEPEYELLDTGVFEGDRYFDVLVEYAKATPEDILMKVTVINRGPEPARLHILPTLWFRNSWWDTPRAVKPSLREIDAGGRGIVATHPELGERWFYIDGDAPLLFTENETNNERLSQIPNVSPFVKDAFDDYVVHGRSDAINPQQMGTKAAAHFDVRVEPGQRAVFRLRLCDASAEVLGHPFRHFDAIVAARISEADAFHASITPPSLGADARAVMRQALSGMIWSKQYYGFDVGKWLEQHGAPRGHARLPEGRNAEWAHMASADVISTPDKWEYPWVAGWDLAFQSVAMAAVDVDFAKSQLELVLRERYMHPGGQIPASEWNFSDVTPPVHAWATIFLHRHEQALHGTSDIDFLKRIFGKLLANFTWWANRRDHAGKSIFDGGFLGLDTIGGFDRSSQPPPVGPQLEQADGTAWMALFCQNMLEIASEIALSDPAFEDLAVKFADHVVDISRVLNRVGDMGMWDDEDGFYYDVLRLPNGHTHRLKIRSIVGLLPLCATTVLEPEQRRRLPNIEARVLERLARQPELSSAIQPPAPHHRGHRDRWLIAVVTRERLQQLLLRLLDEREFLSPCGIRTVSRIHRDHPGTLRIGSHKLRVGYVAAESDASTFGGNTNWRGPVWLPLNMLLIRALLQFHSYYGDSLLVECPTGSGRMMSLFGVAAELAGRLTGIFLPDERGRRAVYGESDTRQSDPHFRDHLSFYEYFDGDTGAGLGASHSGGTALVATLLQMFATVTASHGREDGAPALHDLVRKRDRSRAYSGR